MSAIKLSTPSSGSISLSPADTASNLTITVPAVTTTMVGTDATQTLTNKTLTTPNIDSAQVATVSGTAPLYMCRAWVNFNGTGTVAIRGSGNVSSISDIGTGLYRINFATNMPDINFSAVGNCAQSDSNQDGDYGDFITFYSYDVTDVNISTCNDSSTVMNLADMENVTAAIFR